MDEPLFQKYKEFIEFEIKDISQRLHELPSVIGYYQSAYFALKSKHTKYSIELDRMWQARYMYYKNEFNIVLNNSEIKSFIEKDLEYLDVKDKLLKVHVTMENIESIIDALNNMRWTIKSLIDWEMFKAGSN